MRTNVKTNVKTNDVVKFRITKGVTKTLPMIGLAGLILLSACGTTFANDAQLGLTDASTILSALESNGQVASGSTNAVAAALVISTLQTYLTAQGTLFTGTVTEATAIAAVQTALTALVATTTNAQVLADAKLAQAGLTALTSTSTTSTVNQVNAAALTVLVDYLASLTPKTVTLGNTNPNAVNGLIQDARTHIGHLKGVHA